MLSESVSLIHVLSLLGLTPEEWLGYVVCVRVEQVICLVLLLFPRVIGSVARWITTIIGYLSVEIRQSYLLCSHTVN